MDIPATRDVTRRGGAGAGTGTSRRRRRRKRSPGQRVLRALIMLVALLLVLVAAGYGYFRYEWAQIQTAPCPECTAVASGAPYNVLVIGSDTRVGETPAEAAQFGDSSNAGGQRSDTIKIVHVDPQAGTASTLSIPRDTFVTLSGVPASSGVSIKNKINAAFAAGPNDPDPNGTGANGLVTTIQHTFGIPISHWIVVNFYGLMDAVNALGGVNMNVPQPVRDYGDCNANGVYSNCTGLDIQQTGCQSFSGAEALALSRSRHFEYYTDGEWQSDGSGDIGRIERQNLVIEAVTDKAKSTYNPIRAASFIASMTHDVTLDDQLSSTALLDLADKYHAFSGSSLVNYTLPTSGASYAPYGGESIEVVDPTQAAQVIAAFLGSSSTATVTTPPLDQYGEPMAVSAVQLSSATGPAATGAAASGAVTAPVAAPSAGSASATLVDASSTAPTTVAPDAVPPYDPTPC